MTCRSCVQGYSQYTGSSGTYDYSCPEDGLAALSTYNFATFSVDTALYTTSDVMWADQTNNGYDMGIVNAIGPTYKTEVAGDGSLNYYMYFPDKAYMASEYL